MMNTSITQRGVTLIEMIIVIAITGMIVVAITVLFGRGIGSYRTQFQQVLTTEDARIHLERISDAIRNARNGTAEGWPVDSWMVQASENELTIITNIDGDSASEEVRYFLEGSQLRIGVRSEPGGEEIVRTLARSLRNAQVHQDLFAYSAAGNGATTVQITFVFDSDDNSEPGPVTLTTIVVPRQSLAGANPGSLAKAKLNYPVSNPPNDHAYVQVDITSSSGQTSGTFNVGEINDGRLRIYDNDYYVNINYQPETVGEDPPEWYAWVGPILVGRVGNQEYYVTDKFSVSELCEGNSLEDVLDTCEPRVVSQGSLQVQYRPAMTYQVGEQRSYIHNIDFNYAGP